MDTLASLGSCLGLVSGVRAVAQGEPRAVDVDAPIGVTVASLASRRLEESAREHAADAVLALLSAGPRTATRVDRAGRGQQISVESLRPGDLVAIDPGAIVPADCRIERGTTALDLSLITGEAAPVTVRRGERAPEGCVNLVRGVEARVEAVGDESTLGRIGRSMSDARAERARVQDLADQITRVFVPAVLLLATVTGAAWWMRKRSIDEAIEPVIALMVAACPCALGLAIPAGLTVARGRGAALGIFIRSPRAIEVAGDIDTVIFDKTGTLSDGTMAVERVVVEAGTDANDILGKAGAVEATSRHPVARAVERAARRRLGVLPAATNLHSTKAGVQCGRVEGQDVTVQRVDDDLAGLRAAGPSLRAAASEAVEAGAIGLQVSIDDRVIAIIVVSERLRPDAARSQAQLRGLGLTTALLTGDEPAAARAVAQACGIDIVLARRSPAEKVDVIRKLQEEGRRIAFVGDGVNDAPALSQADLGIAVESAADVASAASDIALARTDLEAVALAIGLARATRRTIAENLAAAMGYNAIALPMAAAGRLRPVAGNKLMALSSFAVLGNSLRLRNRALRPDTRHTALS